MMKYCKYHPLSPATFYCDSCEQHCCDSCIEVGSGRRETNRCINCGKEVISLGAAYNAEPFWRRLRESFRYPLSTQALSLIILVSVVSTVMSFAPFGTLLILLSTGALMRYAFACLEDSAQGNLNAPDIAAAYSGGLTLLLQLLLILIFIGALTIGAGMMLGTTAATVVGLISLVALPAIIINFAITSNLLESLNPARAFGLITAIGLPYGLILAFIMIMFASVGVLSELIAHELSIFSMIAQSIISNYYTIVIFHIMGYMIFQYQGQLGFTARDSNHDMPQARTELDLHMTKIDIQVKEGELEQAADLFSAAVKKYPHDGTLFNACFDFLYSSNNAKDLVNFSPRYLLHLIKNCEEHKLNLSYKKILQVVPDFKAPNPTLRYALAKACKSAGDSRSTAKLLIGLHKQYPQFEQLGDAYELLADALEDLPQMREQTEKCRQLAIKLKRSQPKIITAEKPQAKASFAVRDPSSSAFDTSAPEVLEESMQEKKESSLAKDLPPIEFK